MIKLLVTSGRGPAECRIAVRLVLERIAEEAMAAGCSCDVAARHDVEDSHGPASAVVVLGCPTAQAERLARRWIGSILWVSPSPVRRHHKRKNWFVGVVRIESSAAPKKLDPRDVRFEPMRAGGPGGQHQNRTESAVRGVHVPTGLAVVAREERSQHRNKAIAIERLAALIALDADAAARAAAERMQAAHDGIERGRPVRTFRGEAFVEVRA